jgi:glycosyltransferase involved in cell wall biosynthesis
MNLDLYYDTEGWAYWRRCKALERYLGDEHNILLARGNTGVKHSCPEDCDLVFQLCYGNVKPLRKSYLPYNPVFVAGLNVGYTLKNELWLLRLLKEADHVIVNNRDFWKKTGKRPGVTWISNGVELDDFYPIKPIEERPRRILWTGSLFHRKTKNYDKILMPMAEKLFKTTDIVCDFRLVESHGGSSRWNKQQMLEWYNTGAIYICASETEGTPNPALEAAACGCPVISTSVGNMPELIVPGVNGYLVEPDVDAFYEAILKVFDNLSFFSNNMLTEIESSWGWDKRAQEYNQVFKGLLG